jgi:hypothetical protein
MALGSNACVFYLIVFASDYEPERLGRLRVRALNRSKSVSRLLQISALQNPLGRESPRRRKHFERNEFFYPRRMAARQWGLCANLKALRLAKEIQASRAVSDRAVPGPKPVLKQRADGKSKPNRQSLFAELYFGQGSHRHVELCRPC